ncbi:uncharacterized protein si:dkey-71d15.2 isoform X2 [Labrus bergylta]|uniref:uncharacterized protein si:dkey-71d15.2 isoform X2 n=1 Tax=Labrus bergylta TaxID=56723 RepID=UPI0033134B7E
MGSYSSALVPDTEEFDSIVSIAEKLNEQGAHGADERLKSELQTLVTLMMEEERKENKNQEPDSPTLQEKPQEASHNGSALPATVPEIVPTQSFSSLLPKALSAVLHPKVTPSLNSDPQPSRDPIKKTPLNLEQLQTELRDLRDHFDQMKTKKLNC